MFGTARPWGVDMAIPILCEPKIINKKVDYDLNHYIKKSLVLADKCQVKLTCVKTRNIAIHVNHQK